MRQARSVNEVLKAVEWILLNVGWTQNASFCDKDGNILGHCTDNSLDKQLYPQVASVCISGAVGLVNTNQHLKNEAMLRLNKAVSGNDPSAMYLNDKVGTTKRRMLALVRRAIAKGNKR